MLLTHRFWTYRTLAMMRATIEVATEEGNVITSDIVDQLLNMFPTKPRADLASDVWNMLSRNFTIVRKGRRGRGFCAVFNINGNKLDEFFKVEWMYSNSVDVGSLIKVTPLFLISMRIALSVCDSNLIFNTASFSSFFRKYDLVHVHIRGSTLCDRLQRRGYLLSKGFTNASYPSIKVRIFQITDEARDLYYRIASDKFKASLEI